MKKAILGAALLASLSVAAQQPKIYIAFQWHMHQPIYTPGENVMETHEGGSLSYNLLDVFTSRTGAYTNWPAQAVDKLIAAGLPGGAQVSFSGSLVENLNVINSLQAISRTGRKTGQIISPKRQIKTIPESTW